MRETCKHKRMIPDTPMEVGGRWTGRGFICTECGFQTLSVETYVPIAKSCSKCGREFEGMPDASNEICDDCVDLNLSRFIEKFRNCSDDPGPTGTCSTCGAGGPGHGADLASNKAATEGDHK